MSVYCLGSVLERGLYAFWRYAMCDAVDGLSGDGIGVLMAS